MDEKKLKKVWEKVKRDYNQGLINSESCLQAALYMHIRQELKTEKVFVEPVLEYNERGSPRFIPDLVVCRNKKIKAIIELKFAPNWYPDVGNDIEKFGKIYESDKRNNFFVTRDPATGEWEQAEF